MNLPMSLSSEKCKTLRQSWITSKYSWGKVKLLPLFVIFLMFLVSVESSILDIDKRTFAYRALIYAKTKDQTAKTYKGIYATNVSHKTIEGRLSDGSDLNIGPLCHNNNNNMTTSNISVPIKPVVLITRAESGPCTFSEKMKHLQVINLSIAAVIVFKDTYQEPSVMKTIQGQGKLISHLRCLFIYH